MSTQRQAQLLGKATVKLMKTKGWKVYTWKNPHWYVYIHKGMMTIRPQIDMCDKITYQVTLSDAHLGASNVEYSTNRSFSDPNQAAEYALKLAESHMRKIQGIISTIRK